jgi:hypothetical protein
MLKKLKKSLNKKSEIKKSEKTVAKKPNSSPKNDMDDILIDRYQMIQEAAYFRAENRNFTGGDPVEDWLAAETDIGGNQN